jgi:hypothetical protein
MEGLAPRLPVYRAVAVEQVLLVVMQVRRLLEMEGMAPRHQLVAQA